MFATHQCHSSGSSAHFGAQHLKVPKSPALAPVFIVKGDLENERLGCSHISRISDGRHGMAALSKQLVWRVFGTMRTMVTANITNCCVTCRNRAQMASVLRRDDRSRRFAADSDFTGVRLASNRVVVVGGSSGQTQSDRFGTGSRRSSALSSQG